jgi:cyclophilin family peptidyl-prolyl cis-trans isomerase/HEAT repeat protein
MKKILFAFFVVFIAFSAPALAQIPTNILVRIVKAEDERRYDKTLEDLIKDKNPNIQTRAILAAGRIGDERAIPLLAGLVDNSSRNPQVDTMAAFALGEIESVKAADAILAVLKDGKMLPEVKARATEAAGKIAAANPSEAKSKELGEAILDALEAEERKGKAQNRDVVLLGLTAVLRVRPEDGDFVAAKFLTNLDARIRADAANTLARLRSKKSNEALRAMLISDDDAVARANAARALGVAEDKEAFTILLEAALEDEDLRVRVSAIRALGALKDGKAAEKLTARGEKLLKAYKKEFYDNAPTEKNELLEIATVLGRILQSSGNEKALKFLHDFGARDSFNSAEITVAIARISPASFLKIEQPNYIICDVNYSRLTPSCWQFVSAMAQGGGELATLDAKDPMREKVVNAMRDSLRANKESEFATDQFTIPAYPDKLRAFARFKTSDLDKILRDFLTFRDVFVRAAAAELLSELPATKENVDALKKAFAVALVGNNKSMWNDKNYNDAQLAILDALFKLDKKESVGILLTALNAPDYLVRKKAFELLRTKDLEKDSPGLPALLENAVAKRKDQLLPYNRAFGTKLGSILNTDADYTRAVSRKNGTVKAVLTTDKGVFTIDLLPENAPLTVDNFIKLARSKYFDRVLVHRVVPNFVMQDGDPRGDGNGGPGWEIRCELNMLSYERGAVGMALSGKDTGGSQWFVTHSPQPHLDGGYTIFGRVNEKDMKIVDSIVRGDTILSVKIIENVSPKGAKTQRK